MEAYVDHTLTEGPASLPLNRLPREAVAAIKARRGPRSSDIDSEIQASLRGLLFRLHLVFRIVERTAAVVERQELLHLGLTAYIGLTLELDANRHQPIVKLPSL